MTRSRSTTRHHRLITLGLILLISVLSFNTALPGSLYAQMYAPPPPGSEPPVGNAPPPVPNGPVGQPGPGPFPGPGSNLLNTREDLVHAVTTAAVSTSFAPQGPVENEPTRFTATIHYARPLNGVPTINVAYANDATLSALDPKQFDIAPVTDRRRNLDEGRPDGQGLALDWSWDVIPRAVGKLTLTLEIQPVLF